MGFLDFIFGRPAVRTSVDGRIACPRAGACEVDVESCHECADAVDIEKAQTHYHVSCRPGASDREAMVSPPFPPR